MIELTPYIKKQATFEDNNFWRRNIDLIFFVNYPLDSQTHKKCLARITNN